MTDNIIDNTSLKKVPYNKKKSEKDLIILVKEKDEKYDINNKDIFRKIDGIRKNLENFENSLINFKKEILNIIKMKKF